MEHMTNGVRRASQRGGPGGLFGLSYVTFQELATRVSHRNTGKACNEPIADQMLQRVSADENLHMIFYRNMSARPLGHRAGPGARRRST